MKKNKGFTLIELLAVIIVLAIIMVLTIPNVLSTMNNSKKKALVVFSKKAIVQAEKYVAEQEMSNNPIASGTVITLSDMGVTDTGTYKGVVTFGGGENYTVQMTDQGGNWICGKTLSGLEASNAVVSARDETTCNWTGFNS